MQDLPDVGAIGDGEVFVYDDGTEAFVGVVLVDPGSIATDLAALAAEVATKQPSATAATDAELAAHNADGTFVHGITNTADLAYTADARFPTTGQKSALAGSSGAPGSGNTYVTNADARNTNARTPTAHEHPQAEVTDLVTDLAAKQDASTAATDSELTAGLALKQATSEKGQANGYASLSAGGTVPSSQIPALALTDVSVVASQAAQLALTAEEGDVAVRSDETKTYVHNGGTAGTMADWTFLQTPASAVLSVNGETGVVVLDATDVGAATSADIAAHSADTTSVHGITDTSVLATDAEVATAVSDHSSDTTSVHGIADTTVLATDAELAAAVAAHEADTTVHGVDTAVLATDAEVAAAVAAHEADTSVHGIADTTVLATDAEVATAVSNHSSDTTAVHGIPDTSVLATDSDVALKENVGEIHGLAVPEPDSGDDGRAIVYDDGTGAWVLAADPAGYTDEQAQDAVGGILADTGTIDFTYTDATPAVTAIVKAASLDESHLTSGASIPQAKVATLVSDLAGKQPLDTDLTAIAALTSTSFGRGLLELANQAALLSAAGAAAASHSHAQSDVTGLVTALVAKMDDGEAAGGVLSGTFPNPGFAVDMATQAELDAVAAGAVVPYASLAKVGVD